MTPFEKVRARQKARCAPQWPHQDFPECVKHVIVNAIRMAWRRVSTDLAAEGGSPLDCSETELTTLIQHALNEMRAQPSRQSGGFTGSMFETLPRDASEESFDGMHIEKKPDLAIRLVSLTPGLMYPAGRAMFVEYKIVDASHSVAKYACEGIRRFVAGEYAWQMPSAMMVAYAGAGYTVPETLVPHLRKCRSRRIDCYLTEQLPEEMDPSSETDARVYHSRHRRPWAYIPTGRPADPITIYHIWLSG